MNTNFSREVAFSDNAAMGRAGMSRRDFIKVDRQLKCVYTLARTADRSVFD